MAANSSQLQETILKAIDAVVTQRNNELKLDKTITGIVKKNIGKRGTKPLYQVEYAGGIIEAVTQNAEDVYTPHTSVYVLIPQSDFSKEKVIIGRASSITTERSKSVVAAAVNRYSIVGANLLESLDDTKSINDISFGLHSFHSRDDDDNHGIEHRAQFLYQKGGENNLINFKEEKASLYKEESSAIMVRADFLTNLDKAQKDCSQAQYGLIFNFVFDNLNAGYGETNGEVLDNIAEIIKGTIQIIEEDGEGIQQIEYISNFALKSYIEDFENVIFNTLPLPDDGEEQKNADIAKWTDDGAYLDECRDKVQLLYENFQNNKEYSKLDKPIFTKTIEAYLKMLDELKIYNNSNISLIENVENIRNIYNDWRIEKIGESPYKYEQFVLSSNDMIGNPMSFGTWNTQYAIFKIDLDTFQYLDNILFYKEGFIESSQYESMWPIGLDPQEFPYGKPDIFVKNLQIYTLNELDEQSGEYTLRVEPFGQYDNTVTNDTIDPNTGKIIEGRKAKFKATLLRKLFEDLSNHNKVSYYWFKQDSRVINANSANYNYLAGAGWSLLDHKEEKVLFSTDGAMNPAYKNNYKCIAVYEPAIDDKTILSYEFSVYNESMQTDIQLEADPGTHFSFDSGTPIIKVLINEERKNKDAHYQELGYNFEDLENPPKYKYIWSISDIMNNYTLFLNELITEDENTTVDEAMVLSSKQNWLNRIEKYVYFAEDNIQLTENPEQATRIKYPVSISSSGFTVTCYVQKYMYGTYRDVGSATLEFTNEDNAIVPENRIHIVNGDQIFQYDEYGKTPTSKAKKDPLIIKPLQVKMISAKGIEISESIYKVEWILPIENTMIIPLESLKENTITGQYQNYVGSELNFDIAELYDPDAYANQITCHVTLNGKDYYKDTNFYFGKIGNNGTNGTDVVAKIDFNQEDGTNLLSKEPLTLYVQKHTMGTKGFLNVGSPTLKSEIQFVGNESSEQDILKLSIYQKESLIDENEFAIPVRWNIAGNASGTTNNTGRFFEIDDSAQSLTWSYNYNEDVSTQGELTKHYFRLQNIKATAQLKTGQTYYAYYPLPIIEYEQDKMPKLQSQRISIDKNFYLKEITYNADGRRPVYNHNQGLKLNNLPKDAIIIWQARGGTDSTKYGSGNNFKIALENEPDISLSFIKNTNNKDYRYSTVTTTPDSIEKVRQAWADARSKAWNEFSKKDSNNDKYIGEYGKRQKIWQKEKDEARIKAKQQAYDEFLRERKYNWLSDDNTIADPMPQLLSEQCKNWTRNMFESYLREDYPPTEGALIDSPWWDKHMSAWWSPANALAFENNWQWEEEETYPELPDAVTLFASEYPITPSLPNKNWSEMTDEEKDEARREGINLWEQTNIGSKSAMVYVLPNDLYNGAATNNRIEAKIYTPTETGVELYATVYAPIYMNLDTFGLESVNAWDGNSITIDEDRGAILAPQIGAGEKDSNNRFTGIVMGKTETYTGSAENEKQIGLFGYAYGAQSIFLDAETGNADFGLPDGTTLLKDNKGNVIGYTSDDYNEGRVELRPGDVSKIGGWRLGRRSIYYTKSGDIEEANEKDYIPNKTTGQIEQVTNSPYSKHHEKDIGHTDSGVLIHSGEDPYISLKGRVLTEEDFGQSGDFPSTSDSFLMAGDSLEVQLDPKSPTLFTIFRHNGNQHGDTYKVNTRTFLAGINSKGELQANTIGNVTPATEVDAGGVATKFAVNSLPAFDDLADLPTHIGFKMNVGNHIMGQLFLKNNGLDPNIQNSDHDPTFRISGGGSNYGEYTRPIALHGKDISLFARPYDVSTEANKHVKETDANIRINTDALKLEVGQNHLWLNRTNANELQTKGNLTVNVGPAAATETKKYIIKPEYSNHYNDISFDENYWIDLSLFNGIYYNKYINPEDQNDYYYTSYINQEHVYIQDDNETFKAIDNLIEYYKVNNEDTYIPINYYDINYYKLNQPISGISYISENQLKENRYDSNYEFIENSEIPFDNSQYLGLEKTEIEKINQLYYMIETTNIDLSTKYIFKTIDDQEFYLKLKDNNIYYHIEINQDNIFNVAVNNFDTTEWYIINNNFYNTSTIVPGPEYYKIRNKDQYIPKDFYENDPVYYKKIIEQQEVPNPDYDETDPESSQTIIEENEVFKEMSDADIEDDTISKYVYFDKDYILCTNILTDATYYKIQIEQDIYPILTTDLVKYYLINNTPYKVSVVEPSLINKYNIYTDDNNTVEYLHNIYVEEEEEYYKLNVPINNIEYILSININLEEYYKNISDNLDSPIYEQIEQIDPNITCYYQTTIEKPDVSNLNYLSLNEITLDKYYIFSNLQNEYNNDIYILKNTINTDNRYIWDSVNSIFIETNQIEKYHFVITYNGIEMYLKADWQEQNLNATPLTLTRYVRNGDNFIPANSQQIREWTITSTASESDYIFSSKTIASTITEDNKKTEIKINDDINITNRNRAINISTSTRKNIFSIADVSDTTASENKYYGNIRFFPNSDNYSYTKINISSEKVLADFSLKHSFIRTEDNKKVTVTRNGGLYFTNQAFGLQHNGSGEIYVKKQLALFAEDLGSYDNTTAQISLTAGNPKSSGGAAAELILNSVMNGWNDGAAATGYSHPLFKVSSTTKGTGAYIAIIPECYGTNGSLYREHFSVHMDQKNSGGIQIQGQFQGQQKSYTTHKKTFNIGLYVDNAILSKEGLLTDAIAREMRFKYTYISKDGIWDTGQSKYDGYYASGNNVAKLIQDCLKAANSAKAAADSAYSRAQSAESNAKSYAYDLVYDGGAPRWASAGHNHDGRYAPASHSHSQYATTSELREYATKDHVSTYYVGTTSYYHHTHSVPPGGGGYTGTPT